MKKKKHFILINNKYGNVCITQLSLIKLMKYWSQVAEKIWISFSSGVSIYLMLMSKYGARWMPIFNIIFLRTIKNLNFQVKFNVISRRKSILWKNHMLQNAEVLPECELNFYSIHNINIQPKKNYPNFSTSSTVNFIE